MKSLQKCTEKLSIRLAFTKWFQKLAFIDVISGLTTEKKEYFYHLTVVSGFNSFFDDLLNDSGMISIVPVHPTSRRSKTYSNA